MRNLLPSALGALLLALPAALSAQSYGAAVAVGDGTVFVAEPAAAGRAGTVYVYAPGQSGQWAEAAQIRPGESHVGDGFGAVLAADGEILLASRLDDADGRGAVYVFERQGQAWRQTARIAPEDAAAGDSVGVSLAISGDRALIGSMRARAGAGAAYVYQRGQNGAWTRVGTLTADGAAGGDAFGGAVAISGDYAAVGAPLTESRKGAAYLFRRDTSGAWTLESKIQARTIVQNDAFGASLAILGDTLFVGAPGRDNATGAVFVFEEIDEGANQWGAYMKLLPFEGTLNSRFGSNLHVLGGDLYVGTPGARQFQGAVHLLKQDLERNVWTDVDVLSLGEGAERGQAFGAAFDTDGRIAVAGIPGADQGAGTAAILTRGADGVWNVASEVWSPPASYPAVTGGQVDCSGGQATAFGCEDVDLVAYLPVQDVGGSRGIELNDVWGWTDPATGREYALVGRTDGTAFVDVTSPENPIYVGQLPMTAGSNVTTWRDIKVYANHAYVVADNAGEHGVQVFDLTRLRDVPTANAPVTFEEDAIYRGINSAHNIVIDTVSGFAFSVGSSGGGDTCGGGLHMIDIRDPKNPTFAGCFADAQTGRSSTGYSHDAQCVTYHGPDRDYVGRQICLGANETALSIADVTDKANPVAVARASYPNVGYTHQGWLTEDQRYFYMDDELDEIQGSVQNTRTLIWDVSDLDDPQLVGEFMGTTRATDHNLYIKGDLMYQSNYVSGLRVIDISDRRNPREVGYFDTVPTGENAPGFDGSWSNYPFFQSGNVIVTSGREGLFIVKERKPIS